MAVGGRRARKRTKFTPVRVLSLAGASAACAAVLVTTAVQGHNASCPTALAPAAATNGQEATNYVLGAGNNGNCSLGAPADSLFVALPAPEYAAGARCGSYLEVTGPLGSVRVKVIDQCPECAAGHIDLSQAAFSRIGVLKQGIIPVTYRTLVNPSLPGPLTVRVKEGSSQWWLALRLDNHGNPLTRVRVAGPSGSWQTLSHTDYDYWLAASGAGSGPFRVEVTDTEGHTAVVPNIRLEIGVVQASTVMMYGAGTGTGTGSGAGSTPAASATRGTASRSATASAKTSPSPAPSTSAAPTASSTTPSQAPAAACRKG
jgi:expansin (peptidoglycan-binding protein)